MSKKSLKIVVVLLVIVLLAAIGVGAWFVTHQNQPAATSAGQQTTQSVKDVSANAKKDAKDAEKDAAEKDSASASSSSSSNAARSGSSSSSSSSSNWDNYVDTGEGIGDSTDDGGIDENEGPRIVDGGSGGIGDDDEGNDRG